MSTLDEGLGFNEIEQSYWLKAIKLDPWPLDEGPRPKSGKSRLNLHGSILDRKSINSDQKKELKGDLMIQRTKMQARVHGKDSIRFKQGPNWFLGIWTLGAN